MDEWFPADAVIGEGLSREVEELLMHFIVIFNDESSMDADKSVNYRYVLRSAV